MQISTKSDTKNSENTSTDNYDRENMQKKMMSKHEMLTASFKIKFNQESTMTQ